MIEPKEKPVINSDIDGNAFVIMGTARKALRKAGADEEYINKYTTEAQSGDYGHLLQTTMKYVEFV